MILAAGIVPICDLLWSWLHAAAARPCCATLLSGLSSWRNATTPKRWAGGSGPPAASTPSHEPRHSGLAKLREGLGCCLPLKLMAVDAPEVSSPGSPLSRESDRSEHFAKRNKRLLL